MAWLELAWVVLDLAVDIVPLPLALMLAALARSRTAAVLAVLNLALAMEIIAVLVHPDYPFGSLLPERCIATVLQMLAAGGLVALWRQRQRRLRSIVAH
jgi:peptidoglycan/LPS O-acetylase OafA/YrhL